ncbi:MAG TPA: hypothetical protein ENJ32_08155 [Crenotrichaceae bacterium]|nr:hypothetical protein [Crenotrichaceae bacterium]
MQPKRAQTGALAWYSLGWQWFMVNPVTWVLLIAVYFLFLLLFQLTPVIGPLVGAVLLPGLTAGLLIAAKKSSQGITISIHDLFTALMKSENRFGLLHLGMISLAVALLSGFAIYSIGGDSLMSVLSQSNPADLSEDSMELIQAQMPTLMLIMLSMSAITAMLFMYAIPLVTFEGVPAFTAVKASIWTSIINMLPLTLFGLLYMIFAMLASLPLMLGFLVLIPVTICAWYASYVDIFGHKTDSEITTIV